MKNITGYFILIVSICFSNVSFSSEGIYYINMDVIMNNSLAGKSIIDQLEKRNKSYTDTFKKREEELKNEEKKLLAQKNILDDEEFKKKISLFQNKISDYRNKRKEDVNKYTSQKINAQKDLLIKLTPIMAEYASKNSISFILPKQSIIIGKTELDITNDIIEIMNQKIKVIKLK